MMLTVYLNNNDHHFNEVPITPETLCKDVVELCKEPGETDCYLAETWRGSDREVEEGERMLEVLQQWGKQMGEVRYLLCHQKASGWYSDWSRASVMMKNQVNVSGEGWLENEVSAHQFDMTLSELQDLATQQEQQIKAKQQLLTLTEQQLRHPKLEDQRQQQQDSSEERLQQLRENAHNKEAKLRWVRALRGQVEQKRLSNNKLVDEIEQMTSLFQQKKKELLDAASRVDVLSDQLEALRCNNDKLLLPNLLPYRSSSSSTAELEYLHKELQLRYKLNKDQRLRLQQQRDSLNKRNVEVATMNQRLAELQQRLNTKKASLLQKDNFDMSSDSVGSQHCVSSRVAAVGPYIQSTSTSNTQGIPARACKENFVKPTYPDGTASLPMPDALLKPPPRPAKPASGFITQKVIKLSEWGSLADACGGYSRPSTLPRISNRHNWVGETLKVSNGCFDIPPPVPPRINHASENLSKDSQTAGKSLSLRVLPHQHPSKVKPFSSSPSVFAKMSYSIGTFPGKTKKVGSHLRNSAIFFRHRNTLPLPHKLESYPAAAVRPYTPDLSDSQSPILQKPQTVAASSIYSMYTQQAVPGKVYQAGGQDTLPRSQLKVYGKPVLSLSAGQQLAGSNSTALSSGLSPSDRDSFLDNSDAVRGDAAENNTPRPLSPTKLLPLISHLNRNNSDADMEALRRRLHNAPRPLKKRSSITEPESLAGPNLQKLLYQKTTLAAMETIPMEIMGAGTSYFQHSAHEDKTGSADAKARVEKNSRKSMLPAEYSGDSISPPPLPPCSPIPNPTFSNSQVVEVVSPSIIVHQYHFQDEFAPYSPAPYPSFKEDVTLKLQPSDITRHVPYAKKSILRQIGSERINHSVRVKFDPLALLLDCSLEGEYDLVQRVIYDVDDPSMANDEGITALHNAVCAGHIDIVKFLVQFGVNVNTADSDGWTPLHCAASSNNVQVCKFLVESGAAVFATTYSDMQTAAEKCEEMEDGYAQCSQFLYGVQEKMGVMNRGVVYALWDYKPQSQDELAFSEGDCITVLRREDEEETEWWWARCGDFDGYIPRNLLGLYLRIKPQQRSLA